MNKFGAFPHNLIDGILILLPVKSFLRFKCVSKSFCSTIESRHFINSRLERCSTRKLIELQKVGGIIHAFEFGDDFKRELVLVKPFSSLRSAYGCVYSYCNGLVLLHILRDNFSIWNPSTREYRVLPSLNLNHDLGTGFGLGYDSASDDYKVVVIVRGKRGERPQVWILNLRSSCWRKIGDFPFALSFPRHGGNGDCFVDGALHFACFRDDEHLYSVVSFDVAKETFLEVKRPDFPPFIDHHYMIFNVVGGCLVANLFCETEEEDDRLAQMHSYIRKKEGNEFTWTRLYSITEEQFGKEIFWSFSSVGNHACSQEGDKMFFQAKGKLFCYDHVKRHLQETEVEMNNHLEMLYCTESLASIGPKSSLTKKRKVKILETNSSKEQRRRRVLL